jgi:hypothetical protein
MLHVLKRHSRIGRTYKLDEKYIGRVLPPVLDHEPAAAPVQLLAPPDEDIS